MIRVIRALTWVLLAVCAWLAVFAEQDVTLFLCLLLAAVTGFAVLAIRAAFRRDRMRRRS